MDQNYLLNLKARVGMEDVGSKKSNWMKATYNYQLNKPTGLFKWAIPKRPHMRVPIPDYRSQEIFKTIRRSNRLPDSMEQSKGKIVFKYIEETLPNKKILDLVASEATKTGENSKDDLPVMVSDKLRDLKARHRVFMMDPPPGFDPYCKDHWIQFFTTLINMKIGEEKSSSNEITTTGKDSRKASKKAAKKSILKSPNIIVKRRRRREPIILFPGVTITKKYEPNPAVLKKPEGLPKFDFERIKNMLPTLQSSITEKVPTLPREKVTSSSSDSDIQMPLPAASDSLVFYKNKLQRENARENILETPENEERDNDE